jgi:uncharacterized protein YqgQ
MDIEYPKTNNHVLVTQNEIIVYIQKRNYDIASWEIQIDKITDNDIEELKEYGNSVILDDVEINDKIKSILSKLVIYNLIIEDNCKNLGNLPDFPYLKTLTASETTRNKLKFYGSEKDFNPLKRKILAGLTSKSKRQRYFSRRIRSKKRRSTKRSKKRSKNVRKRKNISRNRT